ncbi:MAG: glycosyltransferase 87 family protein [Planctomycetota bacterium]
MRRLAGTLGARRRALLALLLAVLLTGGLYDVRRRARIDPERPEKHHTDLTVYTEAGAAFHDGRDPYAVTNVRGWHYVYPPLFALLLAPLAPWPSPWQATVWYLVSLLLAWGCIHELRRLAGHAGGDPVPRGFLALALLAALFPVLDTLQRGQAGLAVLYPLLLGLRLSLAGTSAGTRFLGGMLLALPAAIKVTPALPVAALLLCRFVRALRGRESAAFLLPASAVVCGALVWLVLLPAGLLGWRANLGHLETWSRVVLASDRDDPDSQSNPHGARNQSLANAVYRCGNFVLAAVGEAPDDRLIDHPAHRGRPTPMDAPGFRIALHVARGLFAVLLVLLALRTAGAGGELALFGWACALSLVLSPISRGHHFVLLWPAALFVPLELRRRGHPRGARLLAIAAVAMCLAHYAWPPFVGRLGLLGISTAVWCVVAWRLLLSGATGVLRAEPLDPGRVQTE